MACYQRKHSENIFFYLDMRGVDLLDVGRWAPRNSQRKFKKVVGSEISASEVRSQEFQALKPLSKVRGHHFRPIFFLGLYPTFLYRQGSTIM